MLCKVIYLFGIFLFQIVPIESASNYNIDYASGVLWVGFIDSMMVLVYFFMYFLVRKKNRNRAPHWNQYLKNSAMIWIIFSALGFAATIGTMFYAKFMMDQGSEVKDNFHTVQVHLHRRGEDDKILYLSPPVIAQRETVFYLLLFSALITAGFFYFLQRALAKQAGNAGDFENNVA